ncbi:hypothetical protein OJAV_G00232880 [Oryzias javanicus]|uniref:Chemokine interleukin-8-like domain-containing protein n=1 Tax=Oryzias javanicus TaxID=123683 RepID=A0A3S2LXY3_ORYJA|nr:hypothetical protein OJAV_G00232880 [Oryzias javanicus]
MTQKMMKVSVAMVTFFILFSSVADLTSALAYQPSTCCRSFNPNKIPAHVVKSFRETSMTCPKRAVVITTKRNLEVCVDPSKEWVKKLVNGGNHTTLSENSYDLDPGSQHPRPRPPASRPRPPASRPRPPASQPRPPASQPRPPASQPRPPASRPRPPASQQSTPPVLASSYTAPAANASSPGLQSSWTRHPTPLFRAASVRSTPPSSPVPTNNTFGGPQQSTRQQMTRNRPNDLLISCQVSRQS